VMRVLIVDDVVEERDSLRTVLETEGYEVESVAGAGPALEALADPAFDVVLLDIVMPDVDGITLLEEIRGCRPDVDVVVMTAYATLERAVKSIKAGAYDFLIKPFYNDSLLLSLRRVAEKRRLDQERNLLETRLSAAIAQWRTTFDAMSEAVALLSPDFTIIRANRAFAELAGVDVAALQGRKCHELVHGRSTPPEGCVLLQAREKGEKAEIEIDEPHLGRHLHIRVDPVRGEDGEPEYFVHTIQDVTALRSAVKDLRETTAFLASVLEGIGDAVIVVDREMRIISANSGYLRQVRRSLKDVLGRKCHEISHGYARPCDEEGEVCTIRRTFEDGGHHHATHEHTAADGTKIYVDTSSYPLADSQGKVYAAVETLADVTEKVTLQRRLVDSERRYRLLYNSAPDLMHSVDGDGHIIECNDTECRSLGYKREDLLGRHITEILPPEYHELFHRKFAELKKHGHAETEWEILRSDGGRIRVLVKAVAIYDEEGRFIKSSTIMHDVTELRKLEGEKESLSRQLLQAQKMEAIGNMAAGIAHDFNNMLTGIMGFAEIGIMGTSEEATESRFRRIMEISRRASALTGQILIIGRRAPTAKKVIDLGRFVRTSLQTVRMMLEENITLIEDFSEEEKLLIEADEGQLFQVLLNLVVNARDAMEGGGRLTVSTGISLKTCCVCGGDESMFVVFSERDAARLPAGAFGPGAGAGRGYAFLSVADTGPGIPENLRGRVFDPFFSSKEPGRGTGLGLAVVWSVVRAHGGCIEVRTSAGKGTEFRLHFPLSGEEGAAAPSSGPEETDSSLLGGKRVLVADDEEIVRELVAEALTQAGMEVDTAVSGEDALEMFHQRSGVYDVVILDQVMTGITGAETLRRMRRVRPGLKAVIGTGYDPGEELASLDESGGVKIVLKPFSVDRIISTVASLLSA